MNTAFGVILRSFADPAGPFGAGRAWLVTGHRGQDPGSGPVTALAAPAGTSRCLPAVSGGVDRAIRVSTAAVVLAVAGIAAYISHWRAVGSVDSAASVTLEGTWQAMAYGLAVAVPAGSGR